ncbi:MAG: hypothetical protein RLZZ306_200 [Bacteroidota bacterium]|jgi:uncharacterized membrane protein YbhN (UPF0104 family)
MQDNSELNLKQNVCSKNIIFGTKWLFVVIISYVLYQNFKQKGQNLDLIINEFSKIFALKNVLMLCIVFILIIINWACEAKKWQNLSSNFNSLSFTDAFQSVLVGLSLGFITPANLGDFAGRIIHLKNQNRKQGIGAILLGNGIQFYVTLIFGILAYLFFYGIYFPIFHQIIFGLLIICTILGIVIFLQKNNINYFFNKSKWLSTYKIYWESLINFENSTFKVVFCWSILRFLVISLQFVLVLQIFGIDIEFIQLWSVSCLVLLFKTIIPQVNFLTDLGVRELSALHFFSLLSVNLSSVVSAIFFIWVINILLPVLIGGFFFMNIKSR